MSSATELARALNELEINGYTIYFVSEKLVVARIPYRKWRELCAESLKGKPLLEILCALDARIEELIDKAKRVDASADDYCRAKTFKQQFERQVRALAGTQRGADFNADARLTTEQAWEILWDAVNQSLPACGSKCRCPIGG